MAADKGADTARRLTAWLATVGVVFSVYIGRLWQLQIVDGEQYAAQLAARAEERYRLPAARGAILDRNGVRLSGDRAGIRVLTDGSLPREQAAALLEALGETVTARGEVLCEEISETTAAILAEQPLTYRGLLTQVVPIRTYESGAQAAHLLGTVGPVYAEEYETLKDRGYRLTDRIGKSGVELAYEAVLRGTDGVRVTDADGVHTQPAVAGASVQLTLDSRLQAAVQAVLADTAAALREKDEPLSGQDVSGGAAVVLSLTGEVLACASYPTYDLATYSADYTALLAHPDRPLFNRALYGTFPCGSVIKPAVAVAAINEQLTTDLSCDGVYRYYEAVGFAPKCMGRHGAVDTVEALQKSCNVFFMELGRLLGIERLNRYAAAFGLGERTGIEVGEAVGTLSSPANKNGAWVAGDTCQCAIGQLDQRFTPVQLASYALTLANGGVRYRTHLARRILSADGSVEEIAPQVLSRVPMSDEAKRAVHDGMVAVTEKGGTAYEAFRGAPYTVAAKTGTAQHQKGRSDHGVFIAYAPAEAPQIALAVVMENGTSAGACRAARGILDAYFEGEADT